MVHEIFLKHSKQTFDVNKYNFKKYIYIYHLIIVKSVPIFLFLEAENVSG